VAAMAWLLSDIVLWKHGTSRLIGSVRHLRILGDNRFLEQRVAYSESISSLQAMGSRVGAGWRERGESGRNTKNITIFGII
jgi:hypothetical protein